MKKSIILGLTTAVIGLTSLSAFAADDAKYPASDYQPKVIYIDKDAVKTAPASSATKPECPPQKAAAEEVKVAEFDPKYPAANFQPKVIYP